jgi:hypothetical protein
MKQDRRIEQHPAINNEAGQEDSEKATQSGQVTDNNSFEALFQFPTVDQLQSIVAYEYEASQRVMDFEFNEKASQAMHLLTTYHEQFNPIALGLGMHLHVCSGLFKKDNCFGYEKRDQVTYDYTCDNCREALWNESRKRDPESLKQKKVANASSSMSFSNFTLQDAKLRLCDKSYDRKKLKKAYDRLNLRLDIMTGTSH